MAKLIVFNWKLNPKDFILAKKLSAAVAQAAQAAGVQAVVCPPFEYLFTLKEKPKRRGLVFGAQDCFWKNQGAYTGEVSPAFLKKLGVQYVILGHSERRIYSGETNATVNKKLKAALSAGL